MTLIIILELIIFSFLGWIVDSGFRSYLNKRWTNAGYFKGPICPIYGLGGVILIILFKHLESLPLVILFLISVLILTLLEYLGGLFSIKILKVKLWDYSDQKFNFKGQISLLHSFYWSILIIFFYYLIFPLVLIFEKMINVSLFTDLISLFIFMIIILSLLLRKNPQWLSVRNQK